MDKQEGYDIMVSFYHKLDELKKYDPDASFWFLEEVHTEWNHTAYEFLHGYCDAFAYALSGVFGYPIVIRKMKSISEYNLIHAWCENEGNFIDVRGKTRNWNKFWEEFEDWDSFDPEDETFETLRFQDAGSFLEYYGGPEGIDPDMQHCIHAARQLCQDYSDYYA